MSRPIYGIGTKRIDSCNCVPETPPSVSLTLVKSILSSLRTVIDKFYNPFFGVSQVIGNMAMSASVPTVIYVRVIWVNSNTGTKFDKTNSIHLEDLKFIYNNIGKDWHKDPLASFMAAV
jgi:hypothetical protein